MRIEKIEKDEIPMGRNKREANKCWIALCEFGESDADCVEVKDFGDFERTLASMRYYIRKYGLRVSILQRKNRLFLVKEA